MLIRGFYFFLFSIFLSSASCQSLFNREYPGVNICQSGNLQDLNLHDPETRLKDINNLISNNCTHLQGSLYIRGLRNMQGKSIILDSIKEIDGILMIDGNDVKMISLKNLVAIRGIVSKSHNLKQSKELVNVSLQVTGNRYLETLILNNLRSIANHDILFDGNPKLRYLPHKVNWTELFFYPKIQRLHTTPIPADYSSRDACNSSCYIWPQNNDSFCWGPSNGQCQIKTYCETYSEECPTCFYQNGKEINCCDQECIGGCHRLGPGQCTACKQMLDGKKCVQSCPSSFAGGIAGTTKKKDFKYYAGMFCSTKCPDNMLPQDTQCVSHCHDGYFKNASNHCIRCYDNKCKKEDIPCDLMKMTSSNERDFVLSSKLLVQLTNCTKIRGYIIINMHTFGRYNVTVKMLYEHLSNVEYLEGGFNYFVDKHLTNLTFLSKLKTFREANLHAYIQGSASYNKFMISSTSLKFLGLKALKNVTGKFFIGKNDHLCYLNLPWKEIVQPRPLVMPGKNCTDDKCDKQCTKKGCWFAGNEWCYECERFDANGKCVSECSLEKGFFLSNQSIDMLVNKNVPCDKCDKECAVTCLGTSAADCIGGCVHKEENGICVGNCSFMSFEQTGTNKCLPCSNDCSLLEGVKRCTGPSNKPGPGGCNKCNRILIQRTTDPEPVDHIVSCVSDCPNRTYPRAPTNDDIKKFFPGLGGYLCEPCSRLCSQCTGRRHHKDDCRVCDGFWNKDLCVRSCPKDSTFGYKTSGTLRICSRCHANCLNGCSGPNDNHCKRCKHRKIYVNGTNFYCAKSCPADKNIDEKEPETREFVCKSVLESAVALAERKRNKIIISVVVIMLLIVILVVTLVVVCLQRKARTEKLKAQLNALYSNLTEPDSKDENALSKPPNMGRLVIISIEDLIFEDQTRPLGFGAFGYVYKGKWKIPKEDDMLIRKAAGDFYLPVAIKVIKNIGTNQHEAIMQEAKIMSSVSHMHCLRFIGICLSYEMPCLVTAYVKEGSLDKYLIRNKNKITSFIMLSWAEQIADGMLYLTKRGIIHRDLAARNVLVSQFECIQITDFGLSKMLESNTEKEIVIKSGKVPIRWLAIETLLEGRYSYETDVWAYGVTLWEIFTFGKVPYEDQATLDISDFVLKGGRLPQPDICSLDVYIIMVNCWLESPNLRPDFESLMKTFINYCKNPGRYLSIQGDPFEIPSPSNIEMTNMNNPYFDRYNLTPGTAETTLPLLTGRDSMNGLLSDGSFDKDGLLADEDESRNLLSPKDDVDLPTRVTNRSSNIFKLFHDKGQSNNTQNNSVDIPGNTGPRIVPLASLEEPSFRGSSVDEEPRYVADPTDRTIRLRQDHINPRVPLSGTTPKFVSYQPPINSSLTTNEDTDGYLEPICSPNASVLINDGDGYLEPVSIKKKISVDQDDYMVPSYNNSPRESLLKNPNNNATNRLPSMARQSAKLPSMGEDRSPSNLYFPQNLVDDEYLEPQSQSALIKTTSH